MLFKFKLIVILSIILLICYNNVESIAINVVSIFRPDEIKFHKYSAILAATLPLKMQCEKDIQQQVNPFILFLQNLKGIYNILYSSCHSILSIIAVNMLYRYISN